MPTHEYELQYNRLIHKWRLCEFYPHEGSGQVMTKVLGEYITQRAADEALAAVFHAAKVESSWVAVETQQVEK